MKKVAGDMVLLVLAVGVFVVAAAAPTYVYLQTRSATEYVREVENTIGDARSREIAARATKQLLSETADARAILESASVPEDGAATFIALLERDAREAGIALSIGAVSVDPKDGPFNALKVSLRSSGTFSAVMRLLALVETSPYVGVVDSVSMERDEKGVWSSTMLVSVLMRKKL